ncbi:endolytic transglycosylase MltG [Candidatus Parcubacteria bacterium]|nr:endolytic transglycosylase MltG [Candidatus Parcubacteria bacterium]
MLSPESQQTYAVHVRGFIRRTLGRFKLNDKFVFDVLIWAILVSLLYYITIGAPGEFPQATLIKVAQGSTIEQVGQTLKDKQVIRSVFWFEVMARLRGSKVIAGEYYFAEPQNVLSVAGRLSHGDFNLKPIRVTVLEGSNVFQITKQLAKEIPDFDDKRFLEIAAPKEGYLFPDTYFFYPGAEPELVLTAFENNFTKNIASISTSTALFTKPLPEIITMASLLEEEASDPDDRRLIAGILWRRIEMGIPLQVDAVFPYIIGIGSLNLTHADLKTDSPYNTYTNKGLPPGPITNPGLDAILAAVTPNRTTYLYYLSDSKGVTHYCSTYDCHLANKAKYLGN